MMSQPKNLMDLRYHATRKRVILLCLPVILQLIIPSNHNEFNMREIPIICIWVWISNIAKESSKSNKLENQVIYVIIE